jgi:extracellular factor (EF) 3-hydroxypalmitic acid methyl ester biosynthesis protein
MEELFRYLRNLIDKNGPDKADYKKLNSWIDTIIEQKRRGSLTDKDLAALRKTWGDAFSADTCQGFSYLKPHGYAGDYEIIDRLYTRYICSKPHLKKWDRFYQDHDAARAVRNRSAYLKNVLLRMLKEKNEVRVLNVASGPGRDMGRFFDNEISNGGRRVKFDCLEQDEKAIAFAKNVCRPYLSHITFIKDNILRYTPRRRFDLIWASGIFDYFNDRIFVRILKKLLASVKPGGECVIGNFSVDNPSRNYMEIFEWCLHYRSESELIELAKRCGVTEDRITVKAEKTGVNLFMHIVQ